MNRAERAKRLKKLLDQIGQEAPLEELASPAAGLEMAGYEGTADEQRTAEAVRKVRADRPEELTHQEMDGLEAIVLTKGRPVVFVVDGRYEALPEPWTDLNADAVRGRISPLFASVGRVELPNSTSYPYGGTGFVVGPDLLMTNRHVARLFADGRGVPPALRYTAGDAAVDFKRERGYDEDDRSGFLEVRAVAMVHPYWDMALLRVAGLSPKHPPLTLSVRTPEDLVKRNVVVIGYPARDDRNDLALQDRIFKRTYNVKRLQPGKVRPRREIRSFENTVRAMTHDVTTLGGNSGSVLVDLDDMRVVGLHFAGVYLDANYAVPTYELARDPRVAELGLTFSGRVPATNDFDAAWRAAGGESPGVSPPPPPPGPLAVEGGGATWTIPIRVSVSLGVPVPAGTAAAPPPAPAEAPKMQRPVVFDDLESREGFRPDFLDLDGGEKVPLPALTPAGRTAVAKLEDGSPEVKYHRFSVVLHRKRRLALFTAANVDWRPAARLVDGRKPTRRELTGLADGQQELWSTDPRLPEAAQLPDIFYTKDGGAFDKGHLVRRDDVAWGSSFEDIQKANGDTYFTTNCSPQVAGFNRSAGGTDNWGDLENVVQRETKAERAVLFSGPVLDDDDQAFRGRGDKGPVTVQVPRRFWKVVVTAGEAGPQAFGFVLEQDLSAIPTDVEFAVPPAWKRYMKSIAEIEGLLAGLAKLPWLKKYDAYESDEGVRMR